MIQVAITDRYEYAKARYARYQDADLIKLSIETDAVNVSHNLSIPEAEKLIKDLQGWIHEIKD